MMTDQKTLDEFKRLYEEEFGEKIGDKEAFERFSRLMNVLRIVYYPKSTVSEDREQRITQEREENM